MGTFEVGGVLIHSLEKHSAGAFYLLVPYGLVCSIEVGHAYILSGIPGTGKDR